MIEDLIKNVWETPELNSAIANLEKNWLSVNLGLDADGAVESEDAARYIEAAAILACSNRADQRLAAYRIATYAHDLFGDKLGGLNAAVRVVLTRLGNFPGLATSPEVDGALSALPLSMATEEVVRRDRNSVILKSGSLLLTDYQKEIWDQLDLGKSIAISAPTSSGKSFVLQAFITEKVNSSTEFSACYVVPTRALITQVQDDISQLLAVKGITDVEVVSVPAEPGDPLPKKGIYVFTQERLQLFLVNHTDKTFDFLVIDEAHGVQEGDRGIILQSTIDEVISRKTDVQLLFASPTVSNLDVFARMTGVQGVAASATDHITVAQNFINIEVSSPTSGGIRIYSQGKDKKTLIGESSLSQPLTSRVQCLVHAAHHFGADRQSIVYADGQADAEKLAMQIADLRYHEDVVPSDELLALADLAKEAVHPMYALSHTVLQGVGFHYGNIPTILRNALERAFSKGSLQYLVCTSTLLSGVNLPARNLFMYTPHRGRSEPLDSVDFWNLSGRAGRLRREFQGNIYLVSYDKWKVQPLDGPKSAPIIPAIQRTISERLDDLDAVIRNDEFLMPKTADAGLETIFVRLLSDFKRGRVSGTLARADVPEGSATSDRLEASLAVAASAVTLSADIIGASPTVSAHRQQRLYEHFIRTIKARGETGARSLLLKHPGESDAYESYIAALELCHGTLTDRPGSDKQNRFFALMILRWMQGISVSELVDGRLRYFPNEKIGTAIRATLDLVEKELRFNYVKILGCYSTLLAQAFRDSDHEDLLKSIPSISLYLEIGACEKTMISFISLGLSRLVAKKLSDASPFKTMGPSDAIRWVSRQNLEVLGFSVYLRSEVETMISRNRSAA